MWKTNHWVLCNISSKNDNFQSVSAQSHLWRSFFKGALEVRGSHPVERSDLSLDHQVFFLIWSGVWAKQRLVAADHYVPEKDQV